MGHKADSTLANEIITHCAGPPFQVTTYAITVSRLIAGSSPSITHGGTPAEPDSGSELCANSDRKFKELTSSLVLAIEADVDKMEKWELPSRK